MIKKRPAGPYRQASPPPARHRPGARSARLGDVPPFYRRQPGKGEGTMSLHSWLGTLRSAVAPGRGQRQLRRRGSPRSATHRPSVEVLEDRTVPSFSPAVSYPVGGLPVASWVQNQPIVTADFNNDNVPDLAVCNYHDY